MGWHEEKAEKGEGLEEEGTRVRKRDVGKNMEVNQNVEYIYMGMGGKSEARHQRQDEQVSSLMFIQ